MTENDNNALAIINHRIIGQTMIKDDWMKAGLIVDFVKIALSQGWGYVLGGQGEVFTPDLARHWGSIKLGGKGLPYFQNDCAKWYGSKVVDCSGLIVEAFRSAMPYYEDQTANTLYSRCTKKGAISAIPDTPGICVWRSGHIGIYIGDGNIIEARGVNYGVVQTRVDQRDFTNWGMLRDASYEPSGTGGISTDKFVVRRLLKQTSPLMRGDDVRWLQRALNAAGHNSGPADSIFGTKTRAAVLSYQRAKRLSADGIAGPKTVTSLGGLYA